MSDLTRRRFITILAGTAAVLAPGVASRSAPIEVWHGMALGARASIVIDGLGPESGRPIVDACRAEISRLEELFSLYRADSALSRLNRTGRLDHPDPDFLAVLSIARSVNRATGGAFDPTIQPLWRVLAEHHSALLADRTRAVSSLAQDVTRARALIGMDGVEIGHERIAFTQPGMALTLNGIAQGFIADRVAALLRARGIAHVLVDTGEIVAVGGRHDGSAWPVSIVPANGERRLVRSVTLRDRALATSEPLGTTFDTEGRVGHILDPRAGTPAQPRRMVSVEADLGAVADALSTAFCLMADDAITQALAAFPGVTCLRRTSASPASFPS